MTAPVAPDPSTWFSNVLVSAALIKTNLTNWINTALAGLPQSGQATITPSAANTTTTLTVTFPIAFTAAPTAIQLTPITGAGSGTTVNYWVNGVTATGFVLNINRSNTTATTFSWTACP